ncbi:MAG: hypothetical protein QM497_04945 [Sulfurimonas sp.]
MSIPTIIDFDVNQIPIEGSSTFRADASYVWSRINPVIASMNSAITVQNSSSQQVAQDALQVSIDKTATTTAKNEAISAKDEAVLAKNEIQSYVIPTVATYSPTTIEAKLDMAETLNLVGV